MSLKSHITGGADRAYAGLTPELNNYEVTIENNASKVVTSMTVKALTEQDAKNNVSLNGWSVIGVKLIPKDEQKEMYELSADSVNTVIPKKVELENGSGYYDNGAAGRKKTELSSAEDNLSVAADNLSLSNDAGNKVIADNINLLPDSPDLEYISTIHFGFGNVNPVYDDNVSIMLDNLSKDREYILFGNADEVSVGENAPYGSNYELSYLRAEHIKKVLIERGFSADKIRTVGLGVKYPLEKTGKSSLKNRRVEIYGFRAQN